MKNEHRVSFKRNSCYVWGPIYTQTITHRDTHTHISAPQNIILNINRASCASQGTHKYTHRNLGRRTLDEVRFSKL